MMLDRANFLFSKDAEDHSLSPLDLMNLVLEATIELVQVEDNNFAWTNWKNAGEALNEIKALQENPIALISEIKTLFAPTNNLQDLSIDSGWGKAYIKLAAYHDFAQERLHKP